ncbi:rotamase [Ostreococcus tauri]|uniref:Rotamase n=1 Tax=Ostreococcus tauri TaxID=70448 RepID=A0A1Y5I7M5_OSTTA|nr:rotamase [Ostreococcus tauri]
MSLATARASLAPRRARATASVHRRSHRVRTARTATRIERESDCITLGAAFARRCAALALALVISTSSCESSLAALNNPNTRLPRSAKAALRRAVPAVNEETKFAQTRLEDAAYLLRIPQRKPWSAMAKDVDESRRVLSEKKADVLAPVQEKDREEAEAAYERLTNALERLSRAAATQDFDAFDGQIASALEDLSVLQVAQAPGLPFQIPQKYTDLPKLVGRATVEIVVRNKDGSNFGLLNGEKLNEATLEITVDGYNAPLTAGNFVDNVRRGVYRNAPMRRSETAILGGASNPDAPSVPLEIKASDAFDPSYRFPLDVQNGEAIPSIPLSINGSVAMARSSDGQSDKDQFFVYLFDKRSAGLGGLSFEEGEFSVFGYVTKGEEYLGSIGTNAVIDRAKITSGEDKLFNGAVVPIETDFPESTLPEVSEQ